MCKLNDAQKVELYVKLRDRRARRKKEYEEADAADKASQEKIEAILMAQFNESGIDSITTEFGTAYRSTRTTASVADWDAVLDFVKEHDFWGMLEKRVSPVAVEQYIELNETTPPGVNITQVQKINVRRS